jgi:hypothetical protein
MNFSKHMAASPSTGVCRKRAKYSPEALYFT